MPHTRAHFTNLMCTFDVPVRSAIFQRMPLQFYDTTNELDLFTGVDCEGKRFVNLAVKAIRPKGDTSAHLNSVLIHQAAPDSDEFCVRVSLPYDKTWDMLIRPSVDSKELDFLKLSILLAGRPVDMYEGTPASIDKSAGFGKPEMFVALTLCK